MIQSMKKRLSYGNVMATIAVFLVLGGGAAVAAGLKKNSVTTKAIKNGAVTTAKLKNDAVTGAKANESTFGTVPLAARADVATTADKALKADSATSATKAETATTATKAETAVNAETATKADEATLFSGRKVSEVRPGASNVSEPDTTNLTEAGVSVAEYELQVQATSDLVVNASVRLTNNGVAQGFVECELQNEAGGTFATISQPGGQTVLDGDTIQMGLTGFVNDLPQKGLLDPETVRVVCSESVGGIFVAESADITVIRVPVG